MQAKKEFAQKIREIGSSTKPLEAKTLNNETFYLITESKLKELEGEK